MKPIEPNCRALIVNSQLNNGRVVTVGNFIGDVFDIAYDRVWEVDKPMISRNDCGEERINYCIPECYLQRIDDDDVALGSWEELADIWNPRELVV